MEAIELVVKISKEDYERLKEYKKAPFCSLTSRTYEAIANGIPLDKMRAEIEQLRIHKAQFLTSDCKVCIDSQDVLNVIDEYRAESSEDRE